MNANMNDTGADDDDLGPVPTVDRKLLPQAFAILRREHLNPDAEPTTGDLRDALNDIMGRLDLDGETTVAVFRRVCAAMNYLVERQEVDGVPRPARPFDDAIFCTAAARCPVVHVIEDDDEPGEDTFDPVEFEPAREKAAGLSL